MRFYYAFYIDSNGEPLEKPDDRERPDPIDFRLRPVGNSYITGASNVLVEIPKGTHRGVYFITCAHATRINNTKLNEFEVMTYAGPAIFDDLGLYKVWDFGPQNQDLAIIRVANTVQTLRKHLKEKCIGLQRVYVERNVVNNDSDNKVRRGSNAGKDKSAFLTTSKSVRRASNGDKLEYLMLSKTNATVKEYREENPEFYSLFNGPDETFQHLTVIKDTTATGDSGICAFSKDFDVALGMIILDDEGANYLSGMESIKAKLETLSAKNN